MCSFRISADGVMGTLIRVGLHDNLMQPFVDALELLGLSSLEQQVARVFFSMGMGAAYRTPNLTYREPIAAYSSDQRGLIMAPGTNCTASSSNLKYSAANAIRQVTIERSCRFSRTM